ncbi:hypothetical protein CXB51_036240 [Gossypium anomalum]|uniref:Uncharacterized protein n=1 Tax=Gossypium anomalum TaxID=47600 RepID=A0A8J5XLA4_9ROSI|nr:hypothetical protein CXB51_036240 [Gossypium anomalum]
MGMRKVILEVDCLELVQFLCSSVQGNRLPDGMPALAFNPSVGLQIFSVPPEEVFSILLDDCHSMDSTQLG